MNASDGLTLAPAPFLGNANELLELRAQVNRALAALDLAFVGVRSVLDELRTIGGRIDDVQAKARSQVSELLDADEVDRWDDIDGLIDTIAGRQAMWDELNRASEMFAPEAVFVGRSGAGEGVAS